MTLRLPLSGNKHATIVSAYAPTMTNPDEVKDKFYNDLDDVLFATPRTDKLILLGNFNARVGTDQQTWKELYVQKLLRVQQQWSLASKGVCIT